MKHMRNSEEGLDSERSRFSMSRNSNWRLGQLKRNATSETRFKRALNFAEIDKILLNSTEAVEWCQAGAKQGKPEIQTLLGSMYERGEGVEQNFEKAAEWYAKAAEQGYPQAQLIFGSMLFLGRGIPQNHILAHMWINLGASSSNSGDHKVATRLRDLVARNMSPRQVVEAHRAAYKWWAEFRTGAMSDRNQN